MSTNLISIGRNWYTGIIFFCLFDLGLKFHGGLWIFFFVGPWGICGKEQGFHISDDRVVAATNIIRCLQIWFQLEEIDILTLFFCLFNLGLKFLGSFWIFFFVGESAERSKTFTLMMAAWLLLHTKIIRCLEVWF